MKRWIMRVLLVLAALVALEAAFGRLLKNPTGRDAVRAFNKRILNPFMLKKAGQGDWYAGVIETIGRRSGRTYRTPVVADPVVGGFVIPLPYGTGVDWLRNATAAGRATIHHHDVAYPVDRFEVMTALEAAPLLSDSRRRAYRLTRVEWFVRTHLADAHLTVVG